MHSVELDNPWHIHVHRAEYPLESIRVLHVLFMMMRANERNRFIVMNVEYAELVAERITFIVLHVEDATDLIYKENIFVSSELYIKIAQCALNINSKVSSQILS